MRDAKNAVGDQVHSSTAFPRRFMRRLVFVLAGGMFLDGYILGIFGPVSHSMTTDLTLSSPSTGRALPPCGGGREGGGGER